MLLVPGDSNPIVHPFEGGLEIVTLPIAPHIAAESSDIVERVAEIGTAGYITAVRRTLEGPPLSPPEDASLVRDVSPEEVVIYRGNMPNVLATIRPRRIGVSEPTWAHEAQGIAWARTLPHEELGAICTVGAFAAVNRDHLAEALGGAEVNEADVEVANDAIFWAMVTQSAALFEAQEGHPYDRLLVEATPDQCEMLAENGLTPLSEAVDVEFREFTIPVTPFIYPPLGDRAPS